SSESVGSPRSTVPRPSQRLTPPRSAVMLPERSRSNQTCGMTDSNSTSPSTHLGPSFSTGSGSVSMGSTLMLEIGSHFPSSVHSPPEQSVSLAHSASHTPALQNKPVGQGASTEHACPQASGYASWQSVRVSTGGCPPTPAPSTGSSGRMGSSGVLSEQP